MIQDATAHDGLTLLQRQCGDLSGHCMHVFEAHGVVLFEQCCACNLRLGDYEDEAVAQAPLPLIID